MTRHWIEAILGEHGPGLRMVCEHPDNCQSTVDRVAYPCVVAWHWSQSCDALMDGVDEPQPFGRIEVTPTFADQDQEEMRLTPVARIRCAADVGADRHVTDLIEDVRGLRVERDDVRAEVVELGQRVEALSRDLAAVRAERDAARAALVRVVNRDVSTRDVTPFSDIAARSLAAELRSIGQADALRQMIARIRTDFVEAEAAGLTLGDDYLAGARVVLDQVEELHSGVGIRRPSGGDTDG